MKDYFNWLFKWATGLIVGVIIAYSMIEAAINAIKEKVGEFFGAVVPLIIFFALCYGVVYLSRKVPAPARRFTRKEGIAFTFAILFLIGAFALNVYKPAMAQQREKQAREDEKYFADLHSEIPTDEQNSKTLLCEEAATSDRSFDLGTFTFFVPKKDCWTQDVQINYSATRYTLRIESDALDYQKRRYDRSNKTLIVSQTILAGTYPISTPIMEPSTASSSLRDQYIRFHNTSTAVVRVTISQQ